MDIYLSGTIMSIVAALCVMLASLSGKLFTYRVLGAWVHSHLPYLVSFAAGVFGVVAWHLGEETLHEGTLTLLLGGGAAGALLVFLLIKFFSSDHHHHHGQNHGHSHSRVDGRRILLSDAVHNVGDGIILALAFSASFVAGIGAAIAIVLHEAVQEISEFFVLKEAGYSDTEALIRNFAVSSTILFGVLLGLLFSSVEASVALLSAVAAGGIVFVILADLLPNTLHCVREHGKAHVHLLAVVLGIALMLSVQILTPHEEHEDEHVDDVHTEELALHL